MRHLVLGLLAKQPAHGYELKQAVESAMGRLFPPLNIGQIYTTLRRLERDGLVSAQTVSQTERPDKRVYELTAAGRDTLRDWLAQPATQTPVRDEFFMKLLAARVSREADAVDLIDRHRRALLRRLRAVQQVDVSASPVSERLAVEGIALHLQADLRWLEECERLLAKESG